jgi:ABC-type phosphate transport system substrate-binding protein
MRTLFFILLLLAVTAHAEIAVIVNRDNPVQSIESRRVRDIFMGRIRSFSYGSIALPLDKSTLRARFYELLTGRGIEQVNAYWARIMFSGQASPPTIVPDDEAVLKTVRMNEGAIDYIDASRVDDSVRVVLLIRQQ